MVKKEGNSLGGVEGWLVKYINSDGSVVKRVYSDKYYAEIGMKKAVDLGNKALLFKDGKHVDVYSKTRMFSSVKSLDSDTRYR